MSVRQGIIALLAEQPMHGYQLKVEFERRTGGTWPVNIGQVYTTVQRLVRDGLVEPAPAPASTEVEQFRLTSAGVAEATAWWLRPVKRGVPARDELAIKLALAVTAPGVDMRRVVQAQRTETMRALHDYTRLMDGDPGRSPAGGSDLAWSLVLDSLIFTAEAEIRWLDHVEARIARAARTARTETYSRAAPEAPVRGGERLPASAGPAADHVAKRGAR